MALALSVGRQLFVNQLAGTVFGPASTVFYDPLLAYLERGQQVLLVARPDPGGRRLVRRVEQVPAPPSARTVAGGLEGVGARLADGPVGGAGRWVAANAGWLRVVVGVLGVVVLLWGNDVSVVAVVVVAGPRGRAPGARAGPGRRWPCRSGTGVSSSPEAAAHEPG